MWASAAQYTTIWVKYDLVPVASDQPVLVDYGAFHWPYWECVLSRGLAAC